MEKLYLFVVLSLLFATEGHAKRGSHKDLPKSIVVRDTLTLSNLEIINHNGIDSIYNMSVEKIPVYRVLSQKSGDAFTPRDWAEYKTENMRHRLHLNNKQCDKLYKLNLIESKERLYYGDKRLSMRERNLKKQAKAKKNFIKSLNPIQRVAYNNMKLKEYNHPLSISCCKMRGHGNKMVIHANETCF